MWNFEFNFIQKIIALYQRQLLCYEIIYRYLGYRNFMNVS